MELLNATIPSSHHLIALGEPKLINSISPLSTSEVSTMGLQKHLVSARMIPDKTLKQRSFKEKGQKDANTEEHWRGQANQHFSEKWGLIFQCRLKTGE